MDTPSPDDALPPPLPPEPPVVRPVEPTVEPTVLDGYVPVLEPAWTPPAPAMDSRTVLFLASLGFGAVLYVLLLLAGEKTREFASAGLQVLPFLGLALLAYAGERDNTFRLLAMIYWILLVIASAVFLALFTGMAEINMSVLTELRQAARNGTKTNLRISDLLQAKASLHLAVTASLSFLAFIVGACCYTQPVRRAAARIIAGFDADSFVHAVALATVVALTLILFAPLVATGAPPLLTFIQNLGGADLGKETGDLLSQLSDQNILLDQVYSFVWLVPVCLMAVGWPLHRTLSETLRRVGFVAPTLGQVAFGLAAAVVLAIVMTFVDLGLHFVWEHMNWPKTDETAVKQLFKAMTSPLGAVVIGVTAGIGEELFVRGILQPRLGILLSNLFFTSLHALQYSWDGLLSVFMIGIVLGLIRRRTNTSTSAIVHGTYDFLLVMASVYPEYDPTNWLGG